VSRPGEFGVTLTGMAPRDRYRDSAVEDEDEKPTGKSLGSRRRFSEFECPACSAHNPFDEFGNKDEVLCNWCGIEFIALVDDEGVLRLKES
jgi:hypothetical protein